MTGLLAFVRKELLEQVRTFKLPILVVAFVLVGLGSPILAKVTPELLSRFADEDTGSMAVVVTEDPGVKDALFQYQKNFALLPLVVLLMMAGAVSGEKSRGTASMVLVKPVARTAFLGAKIAVPGLVVTAGTVLAAAGCLAYTTVLFGEVDTAGFLLLNALLLLGLWCWVALGLFASTVTGSVAASAGIAVGGWALLAILGALPGLGRWTPGGLDTAVVNMVLGRETGALWPPVLATAVLVALFVGLSAALLRRQEL